MSKYESYRRMIIEDNSISEEKKAMLLRMLDIYLTFKFDDPKECEDEIYSISDDEIMSDKEKILYEYNNIFKKRIREYSDKNGLNNSVLKNFNNKKNEIDSYASGFTKEDITEMQINSSIEPTFYTTYKKILQKYLNLNDGDDLDDLFEDDKKLLK